MRLENHPLLDALCGEYIVGTLRGPARRRFERSLSNEPRVAGRLRYWEGFAAPRYSKMADVQPPARIWLRLERELGLRRYRMPWHERVGLWKTWAVAATVALLFAIGVPVVQQQQRAPDVQPIAELSAADSSTRVLAHLSRDQKTLVLRANRPVLSGPARSYELWLISPEGGNPLSLAVLGSLDATFAIAHAHQPKLRTGAKLAISTEPAGGSPTGLPTGPVILAGSIR